MGMTPQMTETMASLTPPPPEAAAATTPHRVLVVDDNVNAARILAIMLELAGHQVQAVHTGADASKRLADYRPDVILLDIGLPDTDGYTLARELRQRPELAGALLVAVSGYDGTEVIARGRAAGFDAHLTKPVPARRLLELIAAHRPAA